LNVLRASKAARAINIRASSSSSKSFCLEQDFGLYVFNDAKMKSRLSSDTYKKFVKARQDRTPLDSCVAEEVAQALKEWANSHGATHYTHWFQPLINGHTAEKHDSFISLDKDRVKCDIQFKGKLLIGGEADGSSFPSGGLRSTDSARAYTVWDPQTPPFLNMVSGVPTLCIPTCFYSWTGDALDRKIPLLRSANALQSSAKALFDTVGDSKHTHFHTESGVEQEFFIVARDHYEKRPDLLMAKRTLQGAHPAKTQELADHYYAPMPSSALQFIHKVEQSLWKLGIPLTTRHQEVAPNQFEWAPIFSKSSVASDQNLIAMEVMRRIAENNGFEVILHEKPFARINGSGKHNNWSVGSDLVGTFFEPGPDPLNNTTFLLALAATIRGVDLHQDLLRWSIASASNDHRLGGHEAPPAIISVYLGDYVEDLVNTLLGRPTKHNIKQNDYPSIGVDYLPRRERDTSDRNRTSPFAFTGNKFEFRAVGSSQSPAFSNKVLNVILADSFNYLNDELKKAFAKGGSKTDAMKKVVAETLQKHERIIFNGNGYSAEWQAEAKKRGLLNLKSTPDVLQVLKSEKNYKLFESLGVLSRREFDGFIEVDQTNYASTLNLEALATVTLANTYVIPAAIRYQNDVLLNAESVPKALRDNLKNLIQGAVDSTATLKKSIAELQTKSTEDAPRYACDTIKEDMKKVRGYLDSLEECVDNKHWPYPNYETLLLTRHKMRGQNQDCQNRD